jgi:hypothetical protein
MSTVARSPRDRALRAKNSVTTMAEEQPLALDTIKLAVGAIISAALPATRRKNELIGRTFAGLRICLYRERIMRRRIVDFHQDEEGQWVAALECGHNQRLRHNQPWIVRSEGSPPGQPTGDPGYVSELQAM